MPAPGPYDINSVRYVLAPDGTGIPRPTTPDFYQSLSRDFEDFKGHSLVQRFRFDEDWPSWEMHPQGDEFVMLMDGAVEFVLWRHDSEECLHLDRSGQYLIVPRGVWHTARPQEHAELLFITPGEGTLNAEAPQ